MLMNRPIMTPVFEQGFEETLESLIQYAELQASLHYALGDHKAWEYWVKAWIYMECASSQIDSNAPLDNWQDIWTQHHCQPSAHLSHWQLDLDQR